MTAVRKWSPLSLRIVVSVDVLVLCVPSPGMFINRTVDWFVNEKIVRATIFRREWELRLKPRLGSILLFPYVQPENWAFSFDFRYWEDRICLNHLFGYMTREKAEIRDTGWDYDYDGDPDELTMGIPRIWETSWPNLGILTGTYSVSPSEADMDFRLRNCNTFGLWETIEQTDEVCIKWWMTIEETPSEVLELSLLLLHEFHTLADAFWFLDFYHTDNVTLQTWRDRLMKLGARNQSKLDQCFRFLNRNNDGSIGWIGAGTGWLIRGSDTFRTGFRRRFQVGVRPVPDQSLFSPMHSPCVTVPLLPHMQ